MLLSFRQYPPTGGLYGIILETNLDQRPISQPSGPRSHIRIRHNPAFGIAPKVVRREPLNTRFASVLAHHVPDRLLRQTVDPSAPVLVYPPEQFAGLPFQVNDGPVVFSLLDVAEVQVNRFVSSKAAGGRIARSARSAFPSASDGLVYSRVVGTAPESANSQGEPRSSSRP